MLPDGLFHSDDRSSGYEPSEPADDDRSHCHRDGEAVQDRHIAQPATHQAAPAITKLRHSPSSAQPLDGVLQGSSHPWHGKRPMDHAKFFAGDRTLLMHWLA